MRSRITLGALFGTAGGFVGFLLQESLVPHNLGLELPPYYQILAGLLVGAMIGMALGAVEGAAVGSNERLIGGAASGAAIGALGGVFGMYFGGVLYGIALFGHDPLNLETSHNILDFTHLVVARALGWSLLGALPGLAAGAATRSRRRALHGLLGGLLGGFVGGMLFDLVASLITGPLEAPLAAASGHHMIETGGPSRAIGFTGIGLFAGLFIGLVDEVMKQAWVRVLAGRNEGRDFIVSKPLTILGRDERADIPLFGDPALAPQHAAIRIESNRHVLYDGGTPPACLVNGQPVQPSAVLRDGDMIQLGQVRILFREKASASRVSQRAADVDKAPVRGGGSTAIPGNLCPYCGAPKDAAGNCLCTVPEAAGGAPGPTPIAAPPRRQPLPASLAGWPGAAPAAPGGQPALSVVEGPCAGRAFPLPPGTARIGREPDLEIMLAEDHTVSRRHAHIALENGVHVLYDDGSANGTFVNGLRVTSQPLAAGDIIMLGDTRMRYGE